MAIKPKYKYSGSGERVAKIQITFCVTLGDLQNAALHEVNSRWHWMSEEPAEAQLAKILPKLTRATIEARLRQELQSRGADLLWTICEQHGVSSFTEATNARTQELFAETFAPR